MSGRRAAARLTNLLSRPRAVATRATRLHARVLRATRGRVGARNPIAPRQRVLALTTRGRRSGAARATAVGYLEDGDRIVLVASNAGLDRPPAWWLNLCEHPEAEIDLRGERRAVRARAASDDERERLWPRVVDQFEGFDRYASYTEREIPLVMLERRGGAARHAGGRK
ncbi:MAG TPA: nitroreductase/quinone reductase family protein [Thermoleophilaceae bacterium]|nr:nitroreductase/quinone reductase family protein [Thermoleophilaceae bacterium]